MLRSPRMRRFGLALIIALAASAACDTTSDDRPPLRTSELGDPPAGDEIVNRGAPVPIGIRRTPEQGPPGQWWLPSYDYANSRYVELDQINTSNVANLRVVTTASTGINRGHEGQPLVVGDHMYVVTPFPNLLISIDLTVPGGETDWIYDPNPDPRAVGIACCDVVNRGASYADGRIVYATLDGHVVAVDADTGEELWKTRVGNIDIGETITMAPLVVKDVVIVGNSGAELGVRGWLKALELSSGDVRWTAFSTGPDEETLMGGPGFRPFYEADRAPDLGLTTWPAGQWRLGGGTVWGWLSYDPELDLVYYGTGNPGVWNADLRPGDNKWATSIIARDPDDGHARWAWQPVRHDAWDYDEIMENILVDMPWQGRMRRLLIHPGRVGFVFVLDRETGELLSAEKFSPPVNWAYGYDLESGIALEDPAKRTHMGQVTRNICPSSSGAKEFNPSAISPRTGLLYIPVHNICMDFEGIEANYIEGTPYLGADVLMYPGPGDFRGEVVGWDLATQRRVWAVREPFPVNGGMLATSGDLVFYGTMDGWFKALDARTGAELWKFKLASGVVANPITYRGPDGQQYVAVYAGIGGWLGINAFPLISADDPTAALGSTGAVADLKKVTAPGSILYVFGL